MQYVEDTNTRFYGLSTLGKCIEVCRIVKFR
jgi:hypothetical protein